MKLLIQQTLDRHLLGQDFISLSISNEYMSKFYFRFEFGAYECVYVLQVTSNGSDRKGYHFALEPRLEIIFV